MQGSSKDSAACSQLDAVSAPEEPTGSAWDAEASTGSNPSPENGDAAQPTAAVSSSVRLPLPSSYSNLLIVTQKRVATHVSQSKCCSDGSASASQPDISTAVLPEAPEQESHPDADPSNLSPRTREATLKSGEAFEVSLPTRSSPRRKRKATKRKTTAPAKCATAQVAANGSRSVSFSFRLVHSHIADSQ